MIFTRYKFQFIFLGVALLSLTMFGIVAYDSSLKLRIQQENQNLHAFSEYISNDISQHVHARTNTTLHAYINSKGFLPSDYFLIIKKDNNIFISGKEKITTNNIPYLTLSDNKETSGVFNNGENQFSWNKLNIKNTQTLLIHQLPNNTINEFFNSIGTPLIITGIIIMWLVFWATMMLNTVINKLKEKNISMQHMVLHDALTDLPNRFLLHDKIEDAIKHAKNNKSAFAIVIIDLKRFKEINDTLGHHVGDALLIAVSDSLQGELDESNIAARFSGDKFAILIPDINQQTFFEKINHLQNIFCKSYQLGDHKIYIDASMGVSFFPEHGSDSAKLTQRAEMSMYVAKKSGLFYSVYNPEEDTGNVENLKLGNDLRNAIANEEFELYYQPQFNASSNKCDHLEALIRWQHPEFGFIPPTQFIPFAENMGLIHQISEWVMRTAIKQCGIWHATGYKFTIAINLSAWDIQEPTLPSRIESLLEQYKVPHSSLIVEVTETDITSNIKRASIILQQLHDSGIRIALDDFGTGYSSLNHLRHFPINEVKIDRSFVSSMISNSDDLALVKAIIDLSHDLKIEVVAEGVETLEEVQVLKSYNCDRLQGYYYSKAVTPAQIISYVTEEQCVMQNTNN